MSPRAAAAAALEAAPVVDAVEHGSLAAALAGVQAVMPPVGKTKTANTETYSYKYADLADVVTALYPVIARHGLAFTSSPTLTADGRFVLRYALVHAASGEREGGDYPLPDPVRTSAQQVGAAVTYARRYAFCCSVGVVPDEDVDARDVPAATPPPPPVDEAWRRGWLARLAEGNSRDTLNPLRAELRQAADVKAPAEVCAQLDERWLERAREVVAAERAAEAQAAAEQEAQQPAADQPSAAEVEAARAELADRMLAGAREQQGDQA